MQRKVLAVLEAHEAANQHRNGDEYAYRLMSAPRIAAEIFGAGHRLTASEASSFRRALNKLYRDRLIGNLYRNLWTANRRWALELLLEAGRKYWGRERATLIVEIETELATLNVARHGDTQIDVTNHNT